MCRTSHILSGLLAEVQPANTVHAEKPELLTPSNSADKASVS